MNHVLYFIIELVAGNCINMGARHVVCKDYTNFSQGFATRKSLFKEMGGFFW